MRRLAALLGALLVAGCSVISVDLSPRIRPLEEETVEGKGDAKILLLDVSGFLSDEAPSGTLSIGTPPPRVPMLVRLREELKKAGDDAKVKALVLRINSPGGTVTASDIIYRELTAFKQSSGRPVVASLMDVAASGSIGVIMLAVNAEGLMQKIGVAASAIKSGERKDMGSPFRALTADERGIFQSVIDGLHRQFVDKVVERRKLPAATAAGLADGRIYTAEQALSHQLIDRIGYVPDALEAARRAAGVDEARVIVYKRPREYRATYYARSEAETGGLTMVSQLAGMTAGGPRFLYLFLP
jgi:protease-4